MVISDEIKSSIGEFKKLCKKYINFLGVHDFHVHYDTEELEEGVACKFYMENTGGQIVTLSLNNTFPFTPKSLKLTAKHEIIEALLLGKIREMLLVYYSQNLVDEEIHRIVRILENRLK